MNKQHHDHGLSVLLLSLLVTAGLLAGGYWFFGRGLIAQLSGSTLSQPPTEPQNPDGATSQPSAQQVSAAASTGLNALALSLPDPDVLTMDGSVTLVTLAKQLQLAYTQVNPNLPTTYGIPDGRPNGTNAGLQNLIDGQVLMSFSSRPLNAQETSAGVVGIPIARDALAVVVGESNPFSESLSMDQLKQIFQGQITNWSEVGGPDLPIRVINRSNDSGTQTFFQDVVLLGQAFAEDGLNFTTLERDETTPMLRMLGENGIGYSTVQQVENQSTVRIVPINDVLPTDAEAVSDGRYPIGRVVYLAVPEQTSPAVKAFVEMTLSSRGQDIVKRVGFLPL